MIMHSDTEWKPDHDSQEEYESSGRGEFLHDVLRNTIWRVQFSSVWQFLFACSDSESTHDVL